MNETHNIEDEELFEEFCINRNLRRSTMENYRSALQRYSNFTNKTLEELITEARDEQVGIIWLKMRKVNKYLMNFKLSLKESNLAESTINLMTLQVRAFYRHNEIELPINKRKGIGDGQREETIDDLPTMEEIRRFMELLNNVYRAMTVVCLSSGMGASEVTSLTFEHLYKASSINPYPETINQLIEQLKAKGDFIPEWDIIRIKRNRPYVTFSSPESVDRIIIYLEELSHKYPEYQPKPTDKLFRGFKSNRPLIANNFCSIFWSKSKEYSSRKTENNRNVMRVHSLRKFFGTTLNSNELPYLTTKRLLGHNVGSTDSAYFKVDIDSLKEDYMKVVSQLITTEKGVYKVNPYEDIKQEVETLKGLVIESYNLPEEISELVSRETLREEAEFEKSMKDTPEYYEKEYRNAMNVNLI